MRNLSEKSEKENGKKVGICLRKVGTFERKEGNWEVGGKGQHSLAQSLGGESWDAMERSVVDSI